MSDIVADARAWLSERDNGTLRTHSENCHQWHAECLVARLVAEVERHRMTEEERIAVWAGALAIDHCDDELDGMESGAGETLRRLWLRTQDINREVPRE